MSVSYTTSAPRCLFPLFPRCDSGYAFAYGDEVCVFILGARLYVCCVSYLCTCCLQHIARTVNPHTHTHTHTQTNEDGTYSANGFIGTSQFALSGTSSASYYNFVFQVWRVHVCVYGVYGVCVYGFCFSCVCVLFV